MDEGAQDATLRDYVRVVSRRKWIVIGAAVLFTAMALAYSFAKTPLYEASSQLIYENQLNVSDPLASNGSIDSTSLQLELSSVASIIASPDLVESARTMLGKTTSGFTVSAAPDGTSGNTVSITAISPNAQTTARAANAYAEAFTAFRKERELAAVRQAEQIIQGRLDSFQSAAARQSADYLTLQQRLQDLQILEATVTGNFRLLVPATAPSKPYTPQPVRNGLVGLVAGVIIGIGAVLLLEQFDTRVRTQEEAAAILGMPLLGHVRKLPAKVLNETPLVVLNDSHSPAAEAIRKLRGSLEFANVDGDLKSLFITSCLQHEGKSLTVCNLALSLAATGIRVVLVDGDLRRPQVHRYLDLPNGTGVSTVLTGKTDLPQALRSRSVGSSLTRVGTFDQADAAVGRTNVLHVLTSGPVPPNPAEIIASKSFSSLVAELQTSFDLVIIDAPALLAVGDTAAIARSVDGLMFLVDLKRAKRPLLLEAAAQMSQMPCRKLGLVLVSPAPSRRYGRDHYSYYVGGEPQAPAHSRT